MVYFFMEEAMRYYHLLLTTKYNIIMCLNLFRKPNVLYLRNCI